MRIIVSIIASALTVVGLQFVPIDYVLPETTNLGAITTINGSDTISSSRTTINNNFTDLDTRKFSLSDWYATTSATQLVKVGTLTTGTWNATAIGVSYGGTGTTSPTSNQVMIGNGSSGFKVVGFGNSGEFLQSNGTGAAPSWASSAVNTASNYTWTGLHTFSGGMLITASSTHNATTSIAASNVLSKALILNGLPYAWPASRGSNESVLSENGSGTLSFSDVTTLGAGAFIIGSTTDTSVNDTTTETSFASGTSTIVLLPAGLLGTSGALQVRIFVTTDSDSGNNNRPQFRLKYNGGTVCTAATASGAANQGTGEVVMTVYNTSASAQTCQSRTTLGTSGEAYGETTSGAVDTSQPVYLTITAQWDGNDAGDTESLTMGGVSVTYLGR